MKRPASAPRHTSSCTTSTEKGKTMAELTISPDEIRSRSRGLRLVVRAGHRRRRPRSATSPTPATASRTSRACPRLMANELIRFADGTLGLALNLDEDEIGVVVLGEFTGIEEGMEVTRTGEVLSVPVGDGYLGRVVDPLGNPIDGLGEIADRGPSRPRAAGARRHAAQVGARAAADRHQGHRRDDPRRPRPAPAHHRRPPDRQDGHRDRHDHQPEGQLGVGRPEQAGPLHLRRDRPEGLDHRLGEGRPRGRRSDGVHDHRRGPGLRPRRLQVPRARTPARPSASTGCTTASTS